MTETSKTIVAVLLTAAGIYGAYYFLVKPKADQTSWLWDNGYLSGSAATARTFEKGYVQAWYDAAKAKKDLFTYNSKQYHTKGGTAV